MKLSEFGFEYPDHLVAQSPLAERGQSRLLIWDGKSESLRHSRFAQLATELRAVLSLSDKVPVLLLVNDSKVYPARIRVQKESGARGEVLILSPHSEQNISCLLRPLKKLRMGDILVCEQSRRPAFRVTSVNPPRVENVSGLPLIDLMNQEGEMPLPPYIHRDPAKVNDPSVSATDRLRYQTVYAKDIGSAAAPTAGLHFTPAVLTDCAEKNISVASVTLHVGLGTFQPVTTESIHHHQMHSEFCMIPRPTMSSILDHVKNDWPIIFVGTTSLRTVESVLLRTVGIQPSQACEQQQPLLSEFLSAGRLDEEQLIKSSDEWIATDLFIRPKKRDFIYRPMCGSGIITNFHQPESTLVMLIAALVGYQSWNEIYRQAVAEQYRLFSYGDSSLLIFPGVR
jgi:S-adenosylmethionine:tRNA ribosyltransferase-isomerase